MEALDGNKNGKYDILVLSQAVQTAGFETAEKALTAGFGAATADNVEKWFENEEITPVNSVATAEEFKAALTEGGTFSGDLGRWIPDGADDDDDSDWVDIPKPAASNKIAVNSSSALKEAIANGEKDIVVLDATLNEKLSLKSDVDATFVDCTISGNNAWGYVNNATFTNCTFDSGSDNAAIHFDKLYGELVVENCTFTSGKVQIGTDGSSSATFNNCVFGETATTSIWAEKGMRFYCPTVFNNCEFNNRVVLAGSNDLPLTFNGCTMEGGKPVYYTDNSDGIIRGGNIPAVTIK